jgi:hypothetical protein
MLRVWSVSGDMQRDEIGAGQQRVEVAFSTPISIARSWRQERIVGHDLHLEAERAAGDDRADIARADQAQRLAGELDAHEAVLRPLARLGRGVGFGDLAGEREHHRDRVLGRGDRVAERACSSPPRPCRGGIGNIDIVDADAGAADDLEIGRGVEDFLRHLGRAADGEAIIFADHRDQLVRSLAGDDIDFYAAIPEDLRGVAGPS